MDIAVNKKARHDYELLEKFDAGIVLTGAEAKSAKSGGLNLRGSHLLIKNGEAFLIGCQIMPYKSGHQGENYDASAIRKLLLKKKEIARLIGKKEEERLTVVPISAYISKNGRVKIVLAVARGKREYEKRAAIKKRENEKEARGSMMKRV